MHIKTFARAGWLDSSSRPAPASRPTGYDARSRGRSSASTSTSWSTRASGWRIRQAIVGAVLANDLLVGIHRIETRRDTRVEIEYPVKTINANERDSGLPDRHRTDPVPRPRLRPGELLTGLELAFTAANQPDWAEFIVRARTPIADGVEVYHYSGRSAWTTSSTSSSGSAAGSPGDRATRRARGMPS